MLRVGTTTGPTALRTLVGVRFPEPGEVVANLDGGVEVPATVLLMPQNPQVLTPTLMTWVHMVRYDSMIEASLLMMGSVLLPAVAAVLLATAGLRVLRTVGAGGTRSG